MTSWSIGMAIERFSATSLVWWVLWAGLIAITILLVLLMRTRWGQAQPLRKCVVLSLLVHVLLACYATTVQIVQTSFQQDEPALRIASIEGFDEQPGSRQNQSDAALRPWDVFAASAAEALTEQMPLDSPEMADAPLDQQIQRPTADNPPKTSPIDLSADSSTTVPQPAVPTSDNSGASQHTPVAATEAPGLAVRKKQSTVRMPAPAGPKPSRLTIDDTPSIKRPPSASTDTPRTGSETGATSPELAEKPNVPDPVNSLAGLDDRPTAATSKDETRAERAAMVPSSVESGTNTAPSDADNGSEKQPDVSQLAESNRRPLPSEALSLDNPLDALVPVRRNASQEQMPELYESRTAPNKVPLAAQRGGGADTEAAVRAALEWLAANQSDDGRWDASRLEAGREGRVAQRNRRGAGARADTAITGLALLTFLGAGHTHLEGPYRSHVARGLEFLLRSQGPDGSLGGEAARFAFMYAHGMATLAISEAFAMTHDRRLEPALRKALRYTLSAQHPSTGGWRYRPGDLGDTSQLGWQLMALRSAELAGIPIPENCRAGVNRFLRSVSAGQRGGFASYRPGERISRTMTAEALVCRLFLGLDPTDPSATEAAEFLLSELPGRGKDNLYYWYYGTLAMYHLGGDYWQRWNEALKQTLLDRQRRDADLAGSWDPDTLWGPHGGRVYTTALATLCLEVYYRYLPLYAEAPTQRKRR